MRRFLRLIGMRKGNASRSKGRIGSKRNKRAANKAVRTTDFPMYPKARSFTGEDK